MTKTIILILRQINLQLYYSCTFNIYRQKEFGDKKEKQTSVSKGFITF